MRMVAKSGCPVIGQTQVNSGHSNRIWYSRPGRGLGKVSSVREAAPRRRAAGSSGIVFAAPARVRRFAGIRGSYRGGLVDARRTPVCYRPSAMDIYCFGDSITYGECDTERGGWVDRLKTARMAPEVSVFNLGIGGETSRMMRARVKS